MEMQLAWKICHQHDSYFSPCFFLPASSRHVRWRYQIWFVDVYIYTWNLLLSFRFGKQSQGHVGFRVSGYVKIKKMDLALRIIGLSYGGGLDFV